MLLPFRLPRAYTHRLLCAHTRSFHPSSLQAKRVLRPFILADIGEGITECEVLKWSVTPKKQVLTFDPLCEVQSDKASVEITSPFDGEVAEICVKEGEVAKVGDKLCVIAVEEEDAAAAEGAEEEKAVKSVPMKSAPAPAHVDVEGEPPDRPRRPHPLDPSAPPASISSPSDTLATPSVRHFARTNKIPDLSVVGEGSGKGGRIEKADVERYLASKDGAGEKELAQAVDEGGKEEDVVLELGRTRWAMYRSMTASLQIPHFGYSTTLDLTPLHRLLPQLNAHIPAQYLPSTSSSPASAPAVSPHSILPSPPLLTSDPLTHYTKLTHLPFLLKALSHAMLAWPLFRSSLTPSPSTDRPTLILRPHADIAIALSTSSGLYTPTIQAVDTLSPYAIAGRLRRLQALGRASPPALTPADLPKRGGTLAVSNVGAIGAGDSAHPLLVPGIGVAIVAIGRAKWVEELDGRGGEGGERVRRLKVGVSWSGDHRVVEGAELAAFVEEWRAWVENPGRMVGAGR